MSRLVQHGAVATDPVCNPFHNVRRFYPWTSKKRVGLGCIAQKSGWAFFKLENWLYTEVSSELLSNVAHRENLGATHIQNDWRGLAMRKCAQADGIRVS